MAAKQRNLKVHTVVDTRTGKVSIASSLLNRLSEQQKHELRTLQLGHDKILNYACPACDQAVYLSGSGGKDDKIYHFRHFPNLGDCPVKDGKGVSREDLLKMMYNGAKESDLHKKLKNWLGLFLESIENSAGFENARVEKRITSSTDRIHWRQPDVSCTYKGKGVVFELQLNGTFVEVIRGREQFYHEEKTYICWLFDKFDPNDTDLSERDIFWLNKSNAFAITEETMRLSEEKHDLYIECHYVNPIAVEDSIQDKWVSCIIPFSGLSLEEGYYKPFYFDSDSARKKLRSTLLVSGFIDYLLGPTRKRYCIDDSVANDNRYVSRFKTENDGFEMPADFSLGFVNVVDAIKFLKNGVTDAMYNNFSNVKQYTNQMIQNYPEFGVLYIMAVKKYLPDFKSDQLSDKLRNKVDVFWKAFKAAQKKGSADGQDRRYDSILEILFPELNEYLIPPDKRT